MKLIDCTSSHLQISLKKKEKKKEKRVINFALKFSKDKVQTTPMVGQPHINYGPKKLMVD